MADDDPMADAVELPSNGVHEHSASSDFRLRLFLARFYHEDLDWRSQLERIQELLRTVGLEGTTVTKNSLQVTFYAPERPFAVSVLEDFVEIRYRADTDLHSDFEELNSSVLRLYEQLTTNYDLFPPSATGISLRYQASRRFEDNTRLSALADHLIEPTLGADAVAKFGIKGVRLRIVFGDAERRHEFDIGTHPRLPDHVYAEMGVTIPAGQAAEALGRILEDELVTLRATVVDIGRRLGLVA